MRLGELLEGLEVLHLRGDQGLEVTGLAYDSRRVEPGQLFICVRGYVHDGHDFLTDAAARGAVAALVERAGTAPRGMAEVVVASTRQAAPWLASRHYGHPTRRLRLVGVTGTNGKTTTTFLIRQVLGTRAPVGLVGTVRNIVGGESLPVERTTPEAVDLQRLFHVMLEAGDRYGVMEVSSHALALHRVDACRFACGVFTNLTRDHLDFHGDFEAYLRAKVRLFEGLGGLVGRPGAAGPADGVPGGGAAVVNSDDPYAAAILQKVRGRALRYGVKGEADVMARNMNLRLDGMSFDVVHPGGRQPVSLQLTGAFNVYNALAAFSVGLLEGVEPAAIAAALEQVAGVPGRFERVPGEQGFAVVVDYAHTPDGLENVLKAARQFARGRVIAVFGCGGDRDRTKRPLMGEIAARLADVAIITSDNPRSEDPTAIIQEVEAGVRGATAGRHRSLVDREEAIRQAINEARPGDVVLIAGKGHETYQILRDRTVPFDDREVAGRVLASLGYR